MSPARKDRLNQFSLYVSALTGVATLIIGIFSSYVVFWKGGSYVDRIERATSAAIKVDEFTLWALSTQVRNGTNWMPANMADFHKDPKERDGG